MSGNSNLFEGASEAVVNSIGKSLGECKDRWDAAGRRIAYKEEFYWPSVQRGEFPRGLMYEDSPRMFDRHNNDDLESDWDYLKRLKDWEGAIASYRISKERLAKKVAELVTYAMAFDSMIHQRMLKHIANRGNVGYDLIGATTQYFEDRLATEAKAKFVTSEHAEKGVVDPGTKTAIHHLSFERFHRADISENSYLEWCNMDNNQYYFVSDYDRMIELAESYLQEYYQIALKQEELVNKSKVRVTPPTDKDAGDFLSLVK